MKSPKVVIAEDEALLRAEIRETLLRLWPDIEICAEVENGCDALAALERHKPQILFLDIQMPGLTGLEVARHASGRAHVVFITAHDQHAVTAFERGAVDYVLKPISLPRLKLTIERLKERLQSPPAALDHLLEWLSATVRSPQQYLRWVSVMRGEEIRLITTEEICYFRSMEKYTAVVTVDGEHLIATTLKTLFEKLDPATFVKVHRGIVVNLNAIQSLHRDFRGRLEIRLKQRTDVLPVSSAHATFFKHL
jgi:DNA-binding LytR/AlgR family response regulator